MNPSEYVAPTLEVATDPSQLLGKEKDQEWRDTMMNVYDRNPELIDTRFSRLNPSTRWRRCVKCGKDITLEHVETVAHLERMKRAFDKLTDGEKIEATKAWLVLPRNMGTPTKYATFCHVIGVETIGKRLELAEAKKLQQMKTRETTIKREK